MSAHVRWPCTPGPDVHETPDHELLRSAIVENSRAHDRHREGSGICCRGVLVFIRTFQAAYGNEAARGVVI